jgi:hypothetical protein
MNGEVETRQKYKLVRGSHGRWENGVFVLYKKGGDDILLTDAERKSLGGRVVPVGETSTTGETDWTFLSEQTVPVVMDYISTVDDINQLNSLKAAEVAGGNRKMVISAVESRVSKLESEKEK